MLLVTCEPLGKVKIVSLVVAMKSLGAYRLISFIYLECILQPSRKKLSDLQHCDPEIM
jgi:hypothetical protein